MKNIQLVFPNEKYLDSYKKAIEEYKENNITTYNFKEITEDMFEQIENNRKGINLKPGRVASTYYWLIENNEFIGQITIRHELNDDLLNYGGHIGYGVRYSKYNQGYGTLMLSLALKKSKELGLDKVLITCNDDNYGSARVIEKNGGILENKVKNIIDGEEIITRRYWINL